MGWEWRFFSPLPIEAGALPLEGEREDVYFPATEEVGLKLRRGEGELEAKLRTDCLEIEGRGTAEKWRKRCLPTGCVSASPGGATALSPGAVTTAAAAAFKFDDGGGASGTDGGGDGGHAAMQSAVHAACHTPLAGLRVRVRKRREYTAHGERTECVFIVDDVRASESSAVAVGPAADAADDSTSFWRRLVAWWRQPRGGHGSTLFAGGGGGLRAPVLVERWQSVSVEVKGKDNMRTAVLHTDLPHEALVIGYPGMVLMLARKAADAAVSDV